MFVFIFPKTLSYEGIVIFFSGGLSLKLSVLIPPYNEEGSVGETVREVFDVLTKEGIPHEILVLNDHSTDRTGNDFFSKLL
jgi:hypothetical protein